MIMPRRRRRIYKDGVYLGVYIGIYLGSLEYVGSGKRLKMTYLYNSNITQNIDQLNIYTSISKYQAVVELQ